MDPEPERPQACKQGVVSDPAETELAVLHLVHYYRSGEGPVNHLRAII